MSIRIDTKIALLSTFLNSLRQSDTNKGEYIIGLIHASLWARKIIENIGKSSYKKYNFTENIELQTVGTDPSSSEHAAIFPSGKYIRLENLLGKIMHSVYLSILNYHDGSITIDMTSDKKGMLHVRHDDFINALTRLNMPHDIQVLVICDKLQSDYKGLLSINSRLVKNVDGFQDPDFTFAMNAHIDFSWLLRNGINDKFPMKRKILKSFFSKIDNIPDSALPNLFFYESRLLITHKKMIIGCRSDYEAIKSNPFSDGFEPAQLFDLIREEIILKRKE